MSKKNKSSSIGSFNEKVIIIFNSYKCANEFDEIKSIPIISDGEIQGYLMPVNYYYKSLHSEYISLFSKWRKENPEGFASIFEVTDKRTEYWLDNILLKREDRILFVIYSLDGTPVGHIGFSSFNYDSKECEIDNVVRGNKTGNKGIMSFALSSLIQWGKRALGLEEILLRVLSDNTHAVKFYEKNGFKKLYDIPLYKTDDGNEIRWIEDKIGDKPDRYFTKMKLLKN